MASDLGDTHDPVEAHGYRFWADYTAAQARNTGKPVTAINGRVKRFFHDVCRIAEPTVALEVGAHEGKFSRWAKRSFPQARCLALEANPYVHAKFRDRMEEIGVDYLHLAAAATNGTVSINIPTQVGRKAKGVDNRMGSLVVHRSAREHETVEVEAVRVDDFLELTPDDRVVAWIDVEGASEMVLGGASDVLTRADAVYIEVEGKEMWPGQWIDLDVAGHFRSLGLVPAMRDIQRPHQYNVVFLGETLASQQQVVDRAARVLRPVNEPRERGAQQTEPRRR